MVYSIHSKTVLVSLVDGRDWYLAESTCAIFILKLFFNYEVTHLIVHGNVLKLPITNLHPELDLLCFVLVLAFKFLNVSNNLQF